LKTKADLKLPGQKKVADRKKGLNKITKDSLLGMVQKINIECSYNHKPFSLKATENSVILFSAMKIKLHVMCASLTTTYWIIVTYTIIQKCMLVLNLQKKAHPVNPGHKT